MLPCPACRLPMTHVPRVWGEKCRRCQRADREAMKRQMKQAMKHVEARMKQAAAVGEGEA